MPVTLTSVYKGDTFYEKVVADFHQHWDDKAGAHPHIMQVFKVEHHHDDVARHKAKHDAYAAKVGHVKNYFFGAKRTCRTGDHRDWTTPCHHHDCNLCSILKYEFNFSKGGVFGKGLYSTSSSTKATEYAESDADTDNNVMLLSDVVVGNTALLLAPDHSLTAPPAPYDSVTGATYEQGGSMKYPETAVYVPEAICVSGMIVYSQKA